MPRSAAAQDAVRYSRMLAAVYAMRAAATVIRAQKNDVHAAVSEDGNESAMKMRLARCQQAADAQRFAGVERVRPECCAQARDGRLHGPYARSR